MMKRNGGVSQAAQSQGIHLPGDAGGAGSIPSPGGPYTPQGS